MRIIKEHTQAQRKTNKTIMLSNKDTKSFAVTRFKGMTVLALFLLMTVTAPLQVIYAVQDNDRSLSALAKQIVVDRSDEVMTISLDINEMKLSDALEALTSEMGVGLSYSSDTPLDKIVTLQLSDVPFHEALYALLEGTNLEPLLPPTKDVLVIKKKEETIINTYQGTVNGQVSDAITGELLPGVNILVQGTTIGTSTDVEGRFELEVPSLDDTLIISYIGYQTIELSIDGSTSLDISLNSSAIVGEELVVVSYGAQSTRSISSSIQHITSEDLGNDPVATIDQKLQGKLSGVTISETSGRPGEGLRIRVRGAASITAGSEPLYVVDGIPIIGGISDISPNQIESISVLKDASATSLYGSRAANGVILIQTKQPVSGQTQFGINAYYGAQHIPYNRRLEMMNAREYAQYRKEVDELNGRTPDPAFQNPDQYGEGTDWFDEITKIAPIQSYNLTFGGGTENFSTSAMLEYFNQDGVVMGTGYDRFSLRINTMFKPNDNLRIGLNIAPSHSNNSNFLTDGSRNYIVGGALLTTPLASPYNSDGSLALTATDPIKSHPNWVRVAKEQVWEDTRQHLLSNAYIEYEILQGLFVKSSGNIELNNSNFNRFDPSTIGRGLNNPPPVVPRAWNNESNYYNWLNENTLRYESMFGEHNFDVLIGFTAQSFRNNITELFGTNFPDDKIQTMDAANQTSINSDIQKWTILSTLARINYTYKDRYILSASFRRDGSSRFGPENRWGNFPSLSIGWIMSEEEFWNIEPITFFKLRASYGTVGNFEIGNYSYYSTISPVYYAFGNSVTSGRVTDNLGDPSLGWERNTSLNIGGDIYLFNDRIQIAYNYYDRNTSNLLYNVQIPLSSGFSNLETNIGELKFWGHDLSIKSINIENNNMTWSTNFNISFDRNKVLALGTQNEALLSASGNHGRHITQPGQPIGMFYGLIFDGFYESQEELDNSATHNTSQVGTIKFRDLNGDGNITLDGDRTIIGSPWPDFTFGITNNIQYKNFDFSTTISGSYGNLVGARHEYTTTNLDASYNNLKAVANRWKSLEDRGDGRYGISLSGSTWLERDWWHSRFLYDGSHITVKNITLGYTIPLNQTSFVSNLRLYGSVQNAFMITGYPGTNPEVSTESSSTEQGIDDSSYPVPRTISFGISLSL